MGWYAGVPAIRIKLGFARMGRPSVDLVHTEFCSIHLDPSEHEPETLVAQTLFADGIIRYRVSASAKRGLEVVPCREEIVPGTVFSSRRRHTRYWRDWSSDVCSSDLGRSGPGAGTVALTVSSAISARTRPSPSRRSVATRRVRSVVTGPVGAPRVMPRTRSRSASGGVVPASPAALCTPSRERTAARRSEKHTFELHSRQ